MRRISRRHGEKLTSLQQAVMWVRDTVHDLWQLIHPMQHRVLSQEVPKWRRPDPGWVKVNSDAAFAVHDQSGATACIIRDHRGIFKAAQACWYDKSIDAFKMEAMACQDELKLAKQNGELQIVLSLLIYGRRKRCNAPSLIWC